MCLVVLPTPVKSRSHPEEIAERIAPERLRAKKRSAVAWLFTARGSALRSRSR